MFEFEEEYTRKFLLDFPFVIHLKCHWDGLDVEKKLNFAK